MHQCDHSIILAASDRSTAAFRHVFAFGPSSTSKVLPDCVFAVFALAFVSRLHRHSILLLSMEPTGLQPSMYKRHHLFKDGGTLLSDLSFSCYYHFTLANQLIHLTSLLFLCN